MKNGESREMSKAFAGDFFDGDRVDAPMRLSLATTAEDMLNVDVILFARFYAHVRAHGVE